MFKKTLESDLSFRPILNTQRYTIQWLPPLDSPMILPVARSCVVIPLCTKECGDYTRHFPCMVAQNICLCCLWYQCASD
uniref:Uncharacterized protein n=1 Tax=Anguilla anguilla TaxID=7936 RepID=A0A0E9PSZ9_ANGAN